MGVWGTNRRSWAGAMSVGSWGTMSGEAGSTGSRLCTDVQPIHDASAGQSRCAPGGAVPGQVARVEGRMAGGAREGCRIVGVVETGLRRPARRHRTGAGRHRRHPRVGRNLAAGPAAAPMTPPTVAPRAIWPPPRMGRDQRGDGGVHQIRVEHRSRSGRLDLDVAGPQPVDGTDQVALASLARSTNACRSSGRAESAALMVGAPFVAAGRARRS